MPINPNKLTDYALFKHFWTGTTDGLSHRGLDEITPQGAQELAKYALEHNLDGTKTAAGQQKIDDDEKAVMKAILEHQHYGAFFEQDARPLVYQKFGIDPGSVHAAPTVKHPVDAGTVQIPSGVSKIPAAQLKNANIEQLPQLMAHEYQQRKSYFEGTGVSAEERGKRVLGLLKSYTDALWARGEQSYTEQVGHQLLDAFEKMPASKHSGTKDFNGAGWSVAQSLVLGLDPNDFVRKFPEAMPNAETTYLSMNDGMAQAMTFVDKYRKALGKDAKAEEYEKRSPLGFMLGEESGHLKRGNLDEKSPFSSSGLNWGVLMFPGDAEVKKLPPKAGFEFTIDCVDALGNFVVAKPQSGDKMKLVDDKGKAVKAEKKIEKDASGKAIAWSAVFKNSAGETVPPEKVLGLLTTASGSVKGDGKATKSVDMWWWGFCDRNTAQRLYKSKYGIPQLDRETIKVKVGSETLSIPKAEAQKLIDADIPDLVTGETFCGFRFNDEPQTVKLKNGQTLEGKVRGLALEAGPGTTRIGEDMIAVHDAPKRPMLGTVEVEVEGGGSEDVDVRDIESITKGPGDKVTIKRKEGWPEEVTGKLVTTVPWDKAKTVGGKKVLKQTDDFVIRGALTIDLQDGSTRRLNLGEVSQVVGETQKDLRLSQYMTWVSQNQGMFATDGSTGVVVSNGMRWVNKLDLQEETGDARPPWAPEGDLTGIEGPIKRQAGDKIVWAQGLYAYSADSDPTSTAFAGWVQVSKNGRILNEGFTGGQPDFGWGASGKLNWTAKSSFNPYVEPEMRIALLVNGVKDTAKLEQMATKLNLPSNWKSYLVPQG